MKCYRGCDLSSFERCWILFRQAVKFLAPHLFRQGLVWFLLDLLCFTFSFSRGGSFLRCSLCGVSAECLESLPEPLNFGQAHVPTVSLHWPLDSASQHLPVRCSVTLSYASAALEMTSNWGAFLSRFLGCLWLLSAQHPVPPVLAAFAQSSNLFSLPRETLVPVLT